MVPSAQPTTTSSWLSCIDIGFFSGVANPVNFLGRSPKIPLTFAGMSGPAKADHEPVTSANSDESSTLDSTGEELGNRIALRSSSASSTVGVVATSVVPGFLSLWVVRKS